VITPDQRETILDSLRVGVLFDKSCRAARLTPATVREEARLDDDFAEALEDAEAIGGAERARTAKPVAAPIAAAPAAPPKPATDGNGQIDLDRVTKEAAEHGPGLFGFLMWQEVMLQARGFHPMSEWWRDELARFYASGKRWALVCVGRGGAKSTTLTRVANCETIFAERHVPPGQRWVWPFISVGTTDAARRIAEVSAMIAALGIEPERTIRGNNPTIEMSDARGGDVALVSLASTIAGVSGPNAIGATIDEEAKLRDKATNANPSSEILASLIQTFRARPNIRAIRCSSAWTEEGSHAQSIAAGDTAVNHVFRLGRFVAEARAGMLEVAAWEEAQGRAADALRIRTIAEALTEQSSAIPTWVGNPTIGAVASREEVDGLPPTMLGRLSRADYWLRENASVHLPAAAMDGETVADQTGIGEMVRKMRGGGSPSIYGADPWRGAAARAVPGRRVM
jgi:hypothetical protein